ncbi:hypothetical protein SAMN02745121_06884 [Nannocystis exedens]|uniref:Uncharacterized protein n=1 Tax=Nannocystis exedens TaxID=54 RepID=A0A1I2FWQ2_9BACT|nr:hypothetical protein [Nannocystis exedens]PCC73767.1 hypothetical protein NAEX_06855 [Nannocystis exedens]SFF09217.1 hypothetical protein SAMN02745121_06884 [Nannocystis exedens]
MPRGASPKREREYEALKREFKQEGRYEGREEEVAARIVNKQRREYGETKAARAKDRAGRSPDRGLAIADYEQLTVPQIARQLDDLDRKELREVRRYEQQHKARKGVLTAVERKLAA